MKKSFKNLALFLMGAIVLVSCKDETEDPIENNPTVNVLTFGNQTVNLKNTGIMEYYGADDGSDPDFQYDGYNFDLTFFGDNLQFHFDSDGEVDSVSGNGLLFYFETFSTDSTKLADGTYTFDEDLPLAANSFDIGAYSLNWDNTDTASATFISSGTLEVSSTGDTYTIEMDLTDENNQKVTGTFKGSFINE